MLKITFFVSVPEQSIQSEYKMSLTFWVTKCGWDQFANTLQDWDLNTHQTASAWAQISEAKWSQVWLVPGWETVREYQGPGWCVSEWLVVFGGAYGADRKPVYPRAAVTTNVAYPLWEWSKWIIYKIVKQVLVSGQSWYKTYSGVNIKK